MSYSLFAQSGTEKTMRLIVNESHVFPLKVINTTTNEKVTTDSGGYFKMTISVGDALTLEENAFYQLSFKISGDQLSQNIVRIYPEPLNTVLQEVKVETVSSKSLGIDGTTIHKHTKKNNQNMDIMALIGWVVNAFKKEKSPVKEIVQRNSLEKNTYVASLPRSVITDYLKIPDDLVEKFYYYLYDDYVVDDYIKNGEEEKWKIHLLDKSFKFLEQEGRLPAR